MVVHKVCVSELRVLKSTAKSFLFIRAVITRENESVVTFLLANDTVCLDLKEFGRNVCS